MSYHAPYADAIRESYQAWDRAVEALTNNAKHALSQAHQAVATSVTAEPIEHLVDYLSRTLDTQSEVNRKVAALSADLNEQILTHGEAVAAAARDYLGTAGEVLRDQAGRQYNEFVQARRRAEQALRGMTTADAQSRPFAGRATAA